MEVIDCSKYVGIVSVFLFLLCCSTFSANAQPGFLSIDCGAKGNYTDPKTNITWIFDDNFIHNLGEKAESYYSEEYAFYVRSLRVFRKPIKKACYELSLTPNVPHLLRLTFAKANSTGSRGFNYSVETIDMLYMEKVVFDNCLICRSGNTFVSADSVLHICLIRTSDCDDPFITAIELRRLKPGMYDTAKPGIMLHIDKRCDMGAENMTRYPEDQFDRLWEPCNSLVTGTKSIDIVHKLISVDDTQNIPPSKVMQTAVVSNTSGSNSMYFSLGQSRSKKALAVFYFAELNSTGNRSFSVGINNVIRATDIHLLRNSSAVGKTFLYDGTTEATVNLQSEISGLSPIINALEIHGLFSSHPLTSSDDVKAVRKLKKALSLNNWTSDPCFGLPWEGIMCSNINTTVRISQINLSGRNLRGPIPVSLGQLTELVVIDISNNNFKGLIPRVLLNKSNFTFNFSGNKHLCRTKHECRRRHFPSIAVGVAGAFITTAILVGIVIYQLKFRSACAQPSPLDYLMVNVTNSSKTRAFTLEEMRSATENFTHKIGQGSFGSVFMGKLQEGTQIAVKVLSVFSKHGIDQFSNEVDLLSKINHKKLVSFLGCCICNESRDLMLVYEYLSAGSLCDNLYDPEAPKYPQLDWKTRLKIALDAAQGLEYLHVGCTPKIIHRDVKTSNILLDSNLNGKLADFGLSRVTGNGETSQINTTIKGTPGYLDPMYYKTHMLTDKSDVYSFGVVLFELICGRKPIDFEVSDENILLTEWVASYLGEDKHDNVNIQKLVDERLGNRYSMKSIIHLINLAWRCIASEPTCRPSIGEVVVTIKEGVAFEEEYYEFPDELSLTSTGSFRTSQ